MVAGQVLTFGLVERPAWLMFVTVSVTTAGWCVDCAWTVAALGPDELSRVDLVTGDLDVYDSPQELGVRRDP